MFEIINETKAEIIELNVINDLLTNVVNDEKLNNCLFNIIIVNNDYIQKLNKDYRSKNMPTDVISFALEDTEDINLSIRILGDIYISLDKAIAQANDYGHSLLRELSFLTVHGLLHLLGYDHMNELDEKIMFEKQEIILSKYEIAR